MLSLPLRTCGACGSIARLRETTRIWEKETNARYLCENEDCRRSFMILTRPGKRLVAMVAPPVVLLLVAALTIEPALAYLAGVMALCLVAMAAGTIMQLRAEKANPVRE